MNEKNKNALKITQQCRVRSGMVYDFKCEGVRLIVRIFPRESGGDPGEWRVEARASDAAEAIAVTAWGATRTEALRDVGQLWVAKTESEGLPPFDWEGVIAALDSVKAL